MWILLVIYLTGYIITYILLGKARKNRDGAMFSKNSSDWNRIGISLVISLISWYGVMIWLMMLFADVILKYTKRHEPPKWLK
jgi:biotin transporter BioY